MRAVLLPAFLLSGTAGLGYQIVWTRLFALGFGHEVPAMLAVVAGFFAGLAVGAILLDRAVSQSRRPALWYAGLELCIAAWAVATVAIAPALHRLAHDWLGPSPGPLRQWMLAFVATWAFLLPATAAMGATLPALDRFVAPFLRGGRAIGMLYAANALGAGLGALASAFWLLPRFGMRQTLFVLVVANGICAAIVLAAAWLGPKRTAPSVPVGRFSRSRLSVLAFATGLLGIGFEVLGVRVLAQALESTIYTFALVLAVYLTGTAIGAAAYQRFARRSDPERLLEALLLGLATATAAGSIAMAHGVSLYVGLRLRWGDSPLTVHLAEASVAGIVFLAATICMGATFSHVAQTARRDSGGVGWVVGLNAAGAAVAPALFGVVALSSIGAAWSLCLVTLGYLLLLPRVGTRTLWAAVPVGALLIFLPPMTPVLRLQPGEQLLARREGALATVVVIEDAQGARRLRVDNRFEMGGTDAGPAERRQAHLPLLLHPAPTRALFLGVASGITFGAAAAHPGLTADGVEIVPEILELLPHFEPANRAPQRQPALRLWAADARRFVRVAKDRYDVVVADLFHPARDGAGSLYTVEHFQAIRDRLEDGGLFCQWLPLHQMDLVTVGSIAGAFLEVFPDAAALLAEPARFPALGLVGWTAPRRYSSSYWSARVRDADLAAELAASDLVDVESLFGTLVLAPDELATLAQGAPRNTDDRPIVTFRAPAFTYARGAQNWDRLRDLLARFPADASFLVDTGSEELIPRIDAYRRARDLYLTALVAADEGRGGAGFATLLRAIEESPRFEPAVQRALDVLREHGSSDPERARGVLQRLVQLRPDRDDARTMLKGYSLPVAE